MLEKLDLVVLSIFALIVISSNAAFAEEASKSTTLKLRQIDLAQKRGAAEIIGDPTKVEKDFEYVATTKDNETCPVWVKSVKGNIAQLDFSGCSQHSTIAIGQTLEPSMMEDSEPPKPVRTTGNGYIYDEEDDAVSKIIPKIYYSTANTLKSYGGYYSSSGTFEYDANSTFGGSIEFFKAPRHHWGFEGGLEVDGSRTVSQLSQNANGTNTVTTGGLPNLSIGDIFGSIMYRWDSFYLPFGLNWSYINSIANANGGSLSGTLGIQFGVGWLFHHVNIEVSERILQYSGNYNYNSYSGSYGLLQISGLQLDLGYAFDL